VSTVLRAGRVVTPDIGGKAKTTDMTAAVIRALR
jgi:isocitrate/isopropylmalate dehydrogenase